MILRYNKYIFYIISTIINLLVPVLYYLYIFSINYNYINIETGSLVLTNLSIIPTLYISLYNIKLLYPEYLISYPIMITSGIYHLCDSSRNQYGQKLCYGNYDLLKDLDYINSNLLFVVYIISITKFYPIIRLFINLLYGFLLYIFFIYDYDKKYDGYEYILIFSSSLITIIRVIYLYCFNNKHDIIICLKNLYLLIAIILSCFAVVSFKFWNQIYGDNTYWIVHSYLWHLLIMISSFFILKYIYTSQNNNHIDIELDIENENKIENKNKINYDDNKIENNN